MVQIPVQLRQNTVHKEKLQIVTKSGFDFMFIAGLIYDSVHWGVPIREECYSGSLV